MKTAGRIYAALMYLFLYSPLVVMIIYSFNAKRSTSVLSFDYAGEKYSFGHWYREVFEGGGALVPLRNSLILALTCAVVTTILGTLAAYGLHHLKIRYLKNAINSVTSIPMMNPDIVTGISMMLLFATAFSIAGFGQTGFVTLLIAHVTFSLPYTILSITPRLRQMDKNLPEAALDLGCTPIQSFFKVQLPFLFPAILSGFIMAFTLSLDDYVISLFTAGASFETLPLYIYSMARRSVPPTIYAVSTLFLVLVLVLLILSNVIQSKALGDEKQN
ncbi:MAG: ABC transporter permease [Clostridia bacterium]|nr:ABC transporter permease [Clostridia bacterium]MBQ3928125.1 ABC transporter permease [Clostridia bacterium]